MIWMTICQGIFSKVSLWAPSLFTCDFNENSLRNTLKSITLSTWPIPFWFRWELIKEYIQKYPVELPACVLMILSGMDWGILSKVSLWAPGRFPYDLRWRWPSHQESQQKLTRNNKLKSPCEIIAKPSRYVIVVFVWFRDICNSLQLSSW